MDETLVKENIIEDTEYQYDSSSKRFRLKSVEEIGNLNSEDLIKYTKSLTEELRSLKDLNKELKDITVHDSLTHIFNRDGINQEINRLMKRGETVSILYIDLGNFKDINDKYGHLKGDEILITFAEKVLQASIKRSGDTSGRYGGDEFIVILPNTSIKGAVKVEDRIQRTLKGVKAKSPDDPSLNMLIADIGMANWNPNSGDTMEKLLINADNSMYHKKTARKEGIKVG